MKIWMPEVDVDWKSWLVGPEWDWYMDRYNYVRPRKVYDVHMHFGPVRFSFTVRPKKDKEHN